MRRRLLMAIVNAFKWIKRKIYYVYNSLVPKTLSGYNMISMDRTAITSMDYSNKSIRLFEENKYYVGLALSNYFSNSTITNLTYSNGSVSFTATSSGYGVAFPIKAEPNTTYYGSFEVSDPNAYKVRVAYYDEFGNFINYFSSDNGAFTTPANTYWVVLILRPEVNIQTTFSKIKISRTNGAYAPCRMYQVQDKTRLTSIEGNSGVINQLADATKITRTTWGGIDVSHDNETGVITLNGTWDGETNIANSYTQSGVSCQVINGHKYMLIATKISGSVSGTGRFACGSFSTTYLGLTHQFYGTTYPNWKPIDTATDTQVNNHTIRILAQDLDANDPISFDNFKFIVYLCDLTTMGIDNVVNVNQGISALRRLGVNPNVYNPYNAGEIKDSVIGEIESVGFNLFNGQWERGNLNTDPKGSEVSSDYYARSVDFIAVQPNQTYYTQVSLTNCRVDIWEYDSDYNFVARTTLAQNTTKTLKANTYYVRLRILDSVNPSSVVMPLDTKVCFNISDTSLNGTYKPYLPRQDLPREYQEVEYLEGGQGQYLATDLTFNHTKTLDIYGKGYVSSNGSRGCIVSEYAQGGGFGLELVPDLRVYNNGYPDFTNNGFRNEKITEYHVNLNRDTSIMTSTCNNTTQSASGLYSNNGVGFYVFVDRALRFSTFNKTHRIYYFKMVKDGALYCHLIPSVRVADNVAGMFDLVNRVFYTNQGTGTFGVGKKVNHNTIAHLPAPITLRSANLSHDTFEITDTEYVFTKNLGVYTFSGSETFTYNSGSNRWDLALTIGQKTASAKVICSNGLVGYLRTTSVISFYESDNPQLTSETNMNALFSNGVKINYELATPQITRISKKHLECVDLGNANINWTYDTASTYPYMRSNYIASVVKKPTNNDTLANIFCHSFQTLTGKNISTAGLYGIAIDNNGYIRIAYNSMPTNATAFKQAMSGIYLFYETESEVEDFNNEIECQSGGTLNANLFHWNENQLIEDVDKNSWSGIQNAIKSVSGNVATFTCANESESGARYIVGLINTHVYLQLLDFKGENSIEYSFNGEFARVVANGDWQKISRIRTISETRNYYIVISAYPYQANTFSIRNPRYIDLTKGFGVGNEPTDINDYRIQRIIKLGYMPTNENGQYMSELCEVLPNAELEFKCK